MDEDFMGEMRTRGFKHYERLDHIPELDDQEAVGNVGANNDPSDLEPARREINLLRKDLSDLREQLAAFRDRGETAIVGSQHAHPWRRIAAIVTTTFILGKLVQKLRLGPAGAAAVPMIAAQLSRRI